MPRPCISLQLLLLASPFFFFNDTATTEIYTLSLHDALPISRRLLGALVLGLEDDLGVLRRLVGVGDAGEDRKSTRLNSSHPSISYAVFCLKKKNTTRTCSPSTGLRCGSSATRPSRRMSVRTS